VEIDNQGARELHASRVGQYSLALQLTGPSEQVRNNMARALTFALSDTFRT
jgi:hypothetical protein